MLEKVLITGASSGIGANYAIQFAARGHDLTLVARNTARLEALASCLRGAHGVAVETITADLTFDRDLRDLEARLRMDTSITMLINNAGIAGGGDLTIVDPDDLEAIISTNVLALTRLACAAASTFVRRGRGTIVNIGSVTALMPESFEPVYSASKAYVLAFTQGLNSQVAGRGVQVQVVLPGVTRTEIWERSGNNIDDLPPEMVMSVEDLVQASLVGLQRGELETIPSLTNIADWQAFQQARFDLAPHLSRSKPADRYRSAAAGAA